MRLSLIPDDGHALKISRGCNANSEVCVTNPQNYLSYGCRLPHAEEHEVPWVDISHGHWKGGFFFITFSTAESGTKLQASP